MAWDFALPRSHFDAQHLYSTWYAENPPRSFIRTNAPLDHSAYQRLGLEHFFTLKIRDTSIYTIEKKIAENPPEQKWAAWYQVETIGYSPYQKMPWAKIHFAMADDVDAVTLRLKLDQ